MRYLLILVITLASCSPTLNQVLKSPHLAEACATKFPVKDSMGEAIITYKPSDNTDFTNQIDSLNGAIYALSLQMESDRHALQDTGKCCEIARGYVLTVDSLITQNKRLKDRYRPCKPDTVTKERIVYRRDTAAEEVQRKEKEADRDKYVIAQADADRYKKLLIWATSALALLTGVFILMLYKGGTFTFITSLFKRK